jgi:hypothetical protein
VLPQTILAGDSSQPFCFHILADSWSSPKNSTPVESSKYRLFPQNTRGGGAAKIASVESTTSRLFFLTLFASQLRPRLCRPSQRPDASLASQSGPLCFNLCVNSAPSAPLYPGAAKGALSFLFPLRFCRSCPLPAALCFHNDTNPLSRNSLVFTFIQNPRGCPPSSPSVVRSAIRHRLKSPPFRFLAIRRSDFCYSAVA